MSLSVGNVPSRVSGRNGLGFYMSISYQTLLMIFVFAALALAVMNTIFIFTDVKDVAFFAANMTTAQSIAAAATDNLNFDIAKADAVKTNEWTMTGTVAGTYDTFATSEAGEYEIDVNLLLANDTADGTATVSVLVGPSGAPVADAALVQSIEFDTTDTARHMGFALGSIVTLNAGDVIQVQIVAGTGATEVQTGSGLKVKRLYKRL